MKHTTPEAFAAVTSTTRKRVAPTRSTLLHRNDQAMFQALAEQSLQGVMILDAKEVIYVNEQIAETTGYSREELFSMGMPGLVQTLVNPLDQEFMLDQLRRKLADRQDAQRRYEFRIRTRSGETRWLMIQSGHINFDGHHAIQGTVLDITEGRQAAEELQRAHDTLEQRVHARTVELEQANAELRRFAHIISHDLRAPLVNLEGFVCELEEAITTITSGVADLLQQLPAERGQQLSAVLHEEVPDALGFIRSATHRMGKLTSALLRWARLGHAELCPERIDTRLLVQNLLHSLSHQLEQHTAHATTGDLPDIVADRTAIELIFANLLSNAINYLDPQRPGEIEIWGEPGEAEVSFYVRDNGRGMTKEQIDRAFEMFRRVAPDCAEGEGVGLAFVRTIVGRCGGRIECRSEPGRGSTFRVVLPSRNETSRLDGTLGT